MRTIRQITPRQWRSGTAAWLGWLFDGLELHLYTLIATPLVVHLLSANSALDPGVKEKSAYIQAAFLVGWAIGGVFFGRLGDMLGRSRALALTVLTYAICTGLCSFAQTWWQLLIFRFIAALGIGGEWAVGASLLVETWPKTWRPWLAAILQTGVNLGVLLAATVVGLMSMFPHPVDERWVFLVGVIPAFLVFWIRRNVPEPAAWVYAEAAAKNRPSIKELFRGSIAPITWSTSLVCALGLSAWWLLLFWHPQHLRQLLAETSLTPEIKTRMISTAFFLLILLNIVGNFFAGWLAHRLGNPRAIALLFVGLGLAIIGAYWVPRGFDELAWCWLPLAGFFGGVFGLFTMYLPPLFPPLLRTSGAGFCYNVGRLAAAAASLIFGLYAPVSDFRVALCFSGGLALIAAITAWWMPDTNADGETLDHSATN